MNNEVNEMKALLVEILLKPNSVIETWETYRWNKQYGMHMTTAGLLHHKGYTKYGKDGSIVSPNYVITERGRKWLDKQQGEHNGTNK